MRRDLKGYFGAEPAPCWPNGKRLAVSFVVNVEEGSELSIGDGDERNESRYEAVEEVKGAPDLCMESHFGYGPRQGYARIAKAFDAYGVKAFRTQWHAATRFPVTAGVGKPMHTWKKHKNAR